MEFAINIGGVAFQNALMYAILAMGFYISFTILDFPDLSVEGTVLLGGVISSWLINAGVNPWLAMLAAAAGGAIAGSVTGLLHVKLKIRPLLCGILVSTSLITVNLVLTSVANGGSFAGDGQSLLRVLPSDTIIRSFPASLIPDSPGGLDVQKIVVFAVVAIIIKVIVDIYLKTKNGLLLRATGDNSRYVTMLGRHPGNSKIIGLAFGNALAALSGSMIAQSSGSATQSMGIGMVVIGLASVIIGTSVFSKIRFMRPTTMVIFGSVIYQACLGIASAVGMPTAYNKLVMAALFTVALVLSGKLGKKQGGDAA